MRSYHLDRVTISILTVGLLVLVGRPAHAYLDPGTGSYLFQIAVGTIIGGAVALKHYWKALCAWAARPHGQAPKDATSPLETEHKSPTP